MTRRANLGGWLIAGGVVSLLLGGRSYAQTVAWDGTTGNWDDDARWGGAEPTSSDEAVIGSGDVTVNLPGETADLIRLGSGGAAQLTVGSGGVLTSREGQLGDLAGDTGAATINGAGSAWDLTGRLYLGLGGTGTLDVLGGASSSAYEAWIGSSTDGVVRVSGAGTTWTPDNAIFVGFSGHGMLTIEGGATVTTLRTRLAYQGVAEIEELRSSGTLNVTGAGSTLNSQIAVAAGYKGDAVINITDGGLVMTPTGVIGVTVGSDASANITDAGSAWYSGGLLRLGGEGASGSLTTSHGGSVYVGADAYANAAPGALIVSGHAGTFGSGLNLSFGSTLVHDGFASIGHSAGQAGLARLRYAGSRLVVSGDLLLGDAGIGTLTLNQGTVEVGGDLRMQTAGGTATLNLDIVQLDDPYIDVTGDAWLGGTLNLIMPFAVPVLSDEVLPLRLIDIAGTRHGTFSGLAEGDLIGTFGGTDLFITYLGGDGNDVVAYTPGLGDLNGDGAFTNSDIAPFVLALTDPSGYASAYPALDPDTLGDFSGDGAFTNADIAGFVDALTGGGAASLSSEQSAAFAAAGLAVVPEPSTLAMLGVAGLLFSRRRRSA